MCPRPHGTPSAAPALRRRRFLAVEMSFVVFAGFSSLVLQVWDSLKKKKKSMFAVLSNLVSLKMHYLVDMLANG